MAKKKQDITDIFVKHRKLTLGVKIVSTFAFTYYLLYFILLTPFNSKLQKSSPYHCLTTHIDMKARPLCIGYSFSLLPECFLSV